MSPTESEYRQLFDRAFTQCNNELDYTNFDVNLSGSTVCTVIFNGTRVYCANAGDSRAIKVAIPNIENGGSQSRKSIISFK
jgi:serine/threonine protein phosphatase PrpC